MDNSKSDELEKKSLIHMIATNGIFILFITVMITYILNRIFDFIWLKYAPCFLMGAYIFFILYAIFNKRSKKMFHEVKKILIIGFLIINPILISILFYSVTFFSQPDNDKLTLLDFSLKTFSDNNFAFLFFLTTIICYFILYTIEEIQKLVQNSNEITSTLVDCKVNCHLHNIIGSIHDNQNGYIHKLEGIECNQNDNIHKLENIITNQNKYIQKLEFLENKLEKQFTFAYTATCIPLRYNKDSNSIYICLIENKSHKEAAWMFPGNHVNINKNQSDNEPDLAEIKYIPHNDIIDSAKNEAGLVDLKLIDLNFQYIDPFESSSKYNYPDTCWPVNAPVFNYLFKVSNHAKCYELHGHRCHYDFTYVGEYNEIESKDAKFKVVEVEFRLDRFKFTDDDKAEDISIIQSILGKEINKSIKRNGNKYQNISADKLFLNSIPLMIYNTLIFYKTLYKTQGNRTK